MRRITADSFAPCPPAQGSVAGVQLDGREHSFGPVSGKIAIAPTLGESRGDAPEVFDQRQASMIGTAQSSPIFSGVIV